MTSESLVAEFAENAIFQNAALRSSDANRAARRLASIYCELRSRGLSDLHLLSHLLGHQHEAVRLWAAAYGLGFNAEASEHVLEALAIGAPSAIRASASMTLFEWREGRLSLPQI